MDYDLLVIGGGTAGMSGVKEAVNLGARSRWSRQRASQGRAFARAEFRKRCWLAPSNFSPERAEARILA